MHKAHLCPTVLMLSPDAIHQLENNVNRHLHGRVRDFRLVVQDDGVILHGRTATYYAKQLAQEAVREAIRLPILANVISVGGEPFEMNAGGDANLVELTDETYLEEEIC